MLPPEKNIVVYREFCPGDAVYAQFWALRSNLVRFRNTPVVTMCGNQEHYVSMTLLVVGRNK
jgi:hypothetical protein